MSAPRRHESSQAHPSNSPGHSHDQSDDVKDIGFDAQTRGLPAPEQTDSSTATHTLDVSGDGSTVKLNGIGPIVVNVDGTVSRISNWDKLSDAERETTKRLVGKRNQQRLATLREAKASSTDAPV